MGRKLTPEERSAILQENERINEVVHFRRTASAPGEKKSVSAPVSAVRYKRKKVVAA